MKKNILSLDRVLRILIYFHLINLFFQLFLRQVIIDFTLWRDIGIFLIISLWFVSIVYYKIKFNFIKTAIGKLIFFYLIYGFCLFLLSIYRGETFIESAIPFRNHFFPFLIAFPAFYAFKTSNSQKEFIYFLFIMFTYPQLLLNIL